MYQTVSPSPALQLTEPFSVFCVPAALIQVSCLVMVSLSPWLLPSSLPVPQSRHRSARSLLVD